jgi:hypothetical protein
MATPPDPRSSQNELAREIDKLLKQLPGADPHLRGDVEPGSGPSANPNAARAAGGATTGGSAAKRPEPSLLAQRLSVWLRALLAAGLAGAITQWPYAHECGRSLYVYVGTIAAVMIGGAWAGVWAWLLRSATAHVLSLIIVFWGIVLAAEQVLPRIGYAAEVATWRCEAP